MDLDRLIADAKELCRDVARLELTDSPLYIVTQTMLPPMLGATTVCYGYTSPSLDLHLHHCLRDFEGRGPVIVLGNLNIQRDFPERTYNKMLGTTLHELAHILERPSLFKPRPYNHFYIRSEAIRVAEAVSREDEDGDGTTPPWTTHESRFMRIAYHLHHRAASLGYDIRADGVYSTERYGMSPAAGYAAAIKSEAKTLSAATFRQICSMAPPPSFKAIYEQDKRTWINSVPQRRRKNDEFDIT